MANNPLSDDREANRTNRSSMMTMSRRAFLPALASSSLAAVPLPANAIESAIGSESGTIWWNELRTRDPLRTRAFYASVVGWTPKVVAQEDMSRAPVAGEKSYTVFTMRGEEVAGAEQVETDDSAGLRPGWFVYVQVENVDEAARMAAEHGGKIVQQPFDAPAFGRMAEIEDPEGNRLGLVSPRA